MIKEKVVFETEDGFHFETKSLAEEHVKLLKFTKALRTLLAEKDLTYQTESEIFDFIVENQKELYFMLLELDEVN